MVVEELIEHGEIYFALGKEVCNVGGFSFERVQLSCDLWFKIWQQSWHCGGEDPGFSRSQQFQQRGVLKHGPTV